MTHHKRGTAYDCEREVARSRETSRKGHKEYVGDRLTTRSLKRRLSEEKKDDKRIGERREVTLDTTLNTSYFECLEFVQTCACCAPQLMCLR